MSKGPCPRCGGFVIPDRETHCYTRERINRCLICGWREYLDPIETLREQSPMTAAQGHFACKTEL